jgi:hypothetical protein
VANAQPECDAVGKANADVAALQKAARSLTEPKLLKTKTAKKTPKP